MVGLVHLYGQICVVWFKKSSSSKFPLINLLFLNRFKSLKFACSNPVITICTVNVWQSIRCLEDRPQLTSAFTPICGNWLPAGDCRLRLQIQGLTSWQGLFDGHILMSFDQLVDKYNIPWQDFFCYLQLIDYIGWGEAAFPTPGQYKCSFRCVETW